ncbi:hypothetical protein ACQPUY_09875 [Clostridium nigeriense]|uniref:hypothetical protein n=1 Tax=Clostridium nigeriense TaxID=1805470 RepID=UPI003D331E70
MELNEYNYISKCISCNGTGRIRCDCGIENRPNKKCLTCEGEGSFSCPICDGEGKF